MHRTISRYTSTQTMRLTSLATGRIWRNRPYEKKFQGVATKSKNCHFIRYRLKQPCSKRILYTTPRQTSDLILKPWDCYLQLPNTQKEIDPHLCANLWNNHGLEKYTKPHLVILQTIYSIHEIVVKRYWTIKKRYTPIKMNKIIAKYFWRPSIFFHDWTLDWSIGTLTPKKWMPPYLTVFWGAIISDGLLECYHFWQS